MSSALARQLVKEKENSEFKPVKLRLKIDLVSYPVRAEGLVNMVRYILKGYPKYDTKLYLLGKLQFWRSAESGVLLYYHYSQVCHNYLY